MPSPNKPNYRNKIFQNIWKTSPGNFRSIRISWEIKNSSQKFIYNI